MSSIRLSDSEEIKFLMAEVKHLRARLEWMETHTGAEPPMTFMPPSGSELALKAAQERIRVVTAANDAVSRMKRDIEASLFRAPK